MGHRGTQGGHLAARRGCLDLTHREKAADVVRINGRVLESQTLQRGLERLRVAARHGIDRHHRGSVRSAREARGRTQRVQVRHQMLGPRQCGVARQVCEH